MYEGLVHAHSGFRWIVLIVVIYALINAARGLSQKRMFEARDLKISSAAMGVVHLQALLGLVLMFISPRVQFSADTMSHAPTRFFTVEHTTMMVIVIVLFTVGHRLAKKRGTDAGRFKGNLWYYGIGLLITLVAIPWPFRGLDTGWF